jgi:hypothetical protein
MVRKISVRVKTNQEAEAIQRALADPEAHALMVIIGSMLPLSRQHRRATLTYVADMMEIPVEISER